MKQIALSSIIEQLRSMGNAKDSAAAQRFFKTGEGEYGEGDKFLGIRVPALRQLAKQNLHLVSNDVCKLLQSPFHEERLCALLIWVYQYAKSDAESKAEIYRLYLSNTRYINNWDLVDSSAHKIVGPQLYAKNRTLLYQLAGSTSLWERRIAVIATLHFIQHDDYADTIALAQLLLGDTQDLIHKATGWMLREVGKRNAAPLYEFLDIHAGNMPRTMLRYAIEKLTADQRKHYMGMRR
ncbi:MAG: DNA alkylation repair protein [Pseudomonadales bacterium]